MLGLRKVSVHAYMYVGMYVRDLPRVFNSLCKCWKLVSRQWHVRLHFLVHMCYVVRMVVLQSTPELLEQ